MAIRRTTLDTLDNSRAQAVEPSPISTLPNELVLEIFSWLDLSSLVRASAVDKKWTNLSKKDKGEFFLKRAIYRELAIGNDKWVRIFGQSIHDEKGEDFEALPIKDIIKDYRNFKVAFPGQRAKKSLIIFRTPKDLSLEALCLLAKQQGNRHTSYPLIWDFIRVLLGNNSIGEPRWMIMTTGVLPESRGKNYAAQMGIVADLANKHLIGYQVPKVLPMAIGVLARFFTTKERLFGGDPLTFTRCQENVNGSQLIMGGFNQGLSYNEFLFYDDNEFLGVAALKSMTDLNKKRQSEEEGHMDTKRAKT